MSAAASFGSCCFSHSLPHLAHVLGDVVGRHLDPRRDIVILLIGRRTCPIFNVRVRRTLVVSSRLAHRPRRREWKRDAYVLAAQRVALQAAESQLVFRGSCLEYCAIMMSDPVRFTFSFVWYPSADATA